MSSSNVPDITWTAAGLIIPTDAEILTGVQADINQAFGGNLNPALSTPQGQLASSTAAIVSDKNAAVAYITNQVDPQYAQDRFQDAIGRIYFLTRNPATATAVQCTLTGLAGAVIPAGTFAQDTNQNTYAATEDITIGSGGTVTGEFQNILTGPIPCPPGTLTQVYQAIPGWDAITNATAGTLGQNVESRADFEFRRKNSVAVNAHGSNQAVYGAVFSVADVLDVYVIDNPTSATVNTGATNYPMLPHSLYVAVVGGLAADIATAIWTKKDLGCDTNGNTSVTVVDESGYSYPQPSYNIKFEIPAYLPILFAVNIVNNPLLPANITSLIQTQILAQFNGTNGGLRERIGGEIFASRYYGPVALADPNVSILSILIGTTEATLNSALVGIDQAPTVSASNIVVNLI